MLAFQARGLLAAAGMDTDIERCLKDENVRQYARLLAHKMRQTGRTWDEIAGILGVGHSTVKRWQRCYGVGQPGEPQVQSLSSGHDQTAMKSLQAEQEAMVREWIEHHTPAQLLLPYSTWTRRAVAAAIRERLHIDMPIRTVGEYLKRWGFTPQRPAKRATQAQDPEQRRRWTEEEFPEIARRAQAEGAAVFFADEVAVKQDTAWVRGYAPRSHTPVVDVLSNWRPMSMVSAVSPEGQMQHAMKDGAIRTADFIAFMEQLIQIVPCKVFLIIDNLKVHHSREVTHWVREHCDRIELFFLPPYSPDLNADEQLNLGLKTELRSRPAAVPGALREIAQKFMQTLHGAAQDVRNFFLNHNLAYINRHMYG